MNLEDIRALKASFIEIFLNIDFYKPYNTLPELIERQSHKSPIRLTRTIYRDHAKG